MVLQFPGNTHTRSLRDTCKSMQVSDEQFDRILQSVLTAVGKPQSTSYTEGVQAIDKMASADMTTIVNRVIATGTGVAMVAAALFLVVSVNTTPPMNHGISIEDGQVPLAAPDFAVESIGDASEGLPVLDGFHVDGEYLYLYFVDVADAEAWQSIYAQDSAGNRIEPVEVNAEAGMVVFPLPTDKLEIFYEDSQGEHARVEVQPD